MRFAALLLLVPLLTSCAFKPATSADNDRLKTMRGYTLALQLTDVSETAGFQVKRNGTFTRNLVSGQLPKPGTPAQTVVADAAAILAANGWTVYLAACIPPLPSGTVASPQAPPPVIPAGIEQTWQFHAYAYRLASGVSYSAHLSASTTDQGRISKP